MEFETPARVALSVGRDATTESSGKDILKKYRELVAQKSSERLHSKEFKCKSNAFSDINTKINQKSLSEMGSNQEVRELDKQLRGSHASLGDSEFPIYEDDTGNETARQLDGKKENTNLIKHLIKEGKSTSSLCDRTALQPRSINVPSIPYNRIGKIKPNAVDKVKIRTPVSVKKKIEREVYELPVSAISPINAKSPLHHGSSKSSSRKNIRRISLLSDTTSKGQTTCVSNEGSPQNFSTIEQNESIWFMAETGSSPAMMASYESKNTATIEDDGELLSIMHSSSTSIDTQSEDFEGSSYFESSDDSHELSAPLGDSAQTFSIDGRSSMTNSYAVNFRSHTTPNPNASMVVSKCSTTDTASGDTVIPIENESWSIDQCEAQVSGITNHGSLKKGKSHSSNEIIMEGLDSCVSPTSRAIASSAVGTSQTQADSPGMFKLATASLIERNKTLVKEVRFVDQHCVELSERNASMTRDIQRLEKNIIDLKIDNESLHDAVVRSSHHSAKMEMSRDTAELKMIEQKDHVSELKVQVESLTNKLEQSNNMKKSVEMELASSIGKYEILLKNNAEADDKNLGLMERLAISQSTSELASASTAESYRDFCNGMQKKVEQLQNLADERLATMTKETHERMIMKEKLVGLQKKYAELGNDATSNGKIPGQTTKNDLVTPQKLVTEPILHNRTPTSTVLAKTLQSELRRAHDVTDRIVEAEKIISITQTKLKIVTRELCASKVDAEQFHAQLRNCKCGGALLLNKKEKNDAVNSQKKPYSDKFHPHSNLVKRITQTRSECEEKKKKFNAAMEKIITIQRKAKGDNTVNNLNEQAIRVNLLHALQQMANVCTVVNASADKRATLYSRNDFDPCDTDTFVQETSQYRENEDQYEDSNRSTSYVPISPVTILENISAPSEIVLNSQTAEVISPVTAIKLSSPFNFSSMKTNTPLKITQFREDILNLECQLDTVNDEKNAVDVGLSHACYELKTLTQIAEPNDIDDGMEDNSTKVELQYKCALSPIIDNVTSEEKQLSINGMNSVTSIESKSHSFKVKDSSLNEWQELTRQESLCLNNKVFHLREELRERNEDIHSFAEKLEHAQSLRQSFEANNVDLQEQLITARQEIDQLNQEVPYLQEEVCRLEEEINATETFISSKSNENRQLNHENQSTLLETIKQLDDLKISYIFSQERLAEEVECSAQLEKVASNLKATICSFEEMLKTKSAELSKANSKVAITSRKLSEAYSSQKNVNQQCSKLQDELTSLTSLRDDYDAECHRRKEAEHEVDTFMTDIKLASEKEVEIEQLLNLKSLEMDAIKSELYSTTISWEAERKEYCNLMEQLQIDLERKAVEQQLSEKTLIDKENMMQIQCNLSNEASEELKKLRSNYAIASEHVRTIEDEYAELKLKQESMDRKSMKKREYMKKLTKRCEEWKICYEKQETDFCETVKQLEDAKVMISDLNEQLQTNNESLHQDGDDNKVENSNESISGVCNECKYLRKAISTESSAVSLLKRDVQKKDVQIISLTRKLKKILLRSEVSIDSRVTQKSKESSSE